MEPSTGTLQTPLGPSSVSPRSTTHGAPTRLYMYWLLLSVTLRKGSRRFLSKGLKVSEIF